MKTRPPGYCRQREKNQQDRAYTRIGGKKIWLGIYGSPESRLKYSSLVAGINNQEPGPPDSQHIPTVVEVMADYLRYAEVYYRRHDGKPGREYELIVDICKYLRRQAGSLPAKEYGPRWLKQLRQRLIEANLSRKYINKQVDRVRRMFRWAASEELIPSDVPQSLSMVSGLRKGRSNARETSPIRPVDPKAISATMEYLPQVVGDMVELQLLTGMRSGELCIMRPVDIDRSGDIWLYSPSHHKTEHLDHVRSIAIGKRAQGILLRYLARAENSYLFRPLDSEAKRRAEMTAARITPLSCGNRPGTNRKTDPKRKPGDRYSVDSYRRAIARAAKAAGVEPWSPHRLRHTMATEVRRHYSLDHVQAVLGHKGARISEVYAELDRDKAIQVARMLG